MIKQKYNKVKDILLDGDIALYSSKDAIGKNICRLYSCRFSHCGFILRNNANKLYSYEITGENFLLGPSYILEPLENRINQFDDFCILRTEPIYREKISSAVRKSMAQSGMSYDYTFPLQRFLHKFFSNRKKDLKENSTICCYMVRDILNEVGINDYNHIRFLMPQDFYNYLPKKKIELIE